MLIILIIPKMVISVALLFFGGKLVLRSDDSAEVIMNSLAAYFVAGMPYVFAERSRLSQAARRC